MKFRAVSQFFWILLMVVQSNGAKAADISRACEAARRADRHYNDNNAAEAAVRMTAWENATQAELEKGQITSDSADHLRRVVEDVMAFGAQITDRAEGHRTIKDFIRDACE